MSAKHDLGVHKKTALSRKKEQCSLNDLRERLTSGRGSSSYREASYQLPQLDALHCLCAF